MIKKTKIGDFELYFLNDGEFWLDGGGYFGVIPKVLWSKMVTPDEKNRVVIKSNPMLVKTPEHNVLIDPGLGNKWTEKQIKIWKIKNEPSVIESLAEIGMTPDDIDVVVATHLHFDHMGAGTRFDENGKAIPVFRNAVHYIQRGEWEDATHPNERTKGTYFLENYMPLHEAGLVKLIDGNVKVVPGISVEVTGGHTKHHQIIFAKSQGETAVYFGGITSSVNHVRVAYTMAFDLYPVEIMESRRELYPRAIEENWLVCLEHDPDYPAIYIKHDGKHYTYEPYEFV